MDWVLRIKTDNDAGIQYLTDEPVSNLTAVFSGDEVELREKVQTFLGLVRVIEAPPRQDVARRVRDFVESVKAFVLEAGLSNGYGFEGDGGNCTLTFFPCEGERFYIV
jgi:hypothetical protein